MSDGWVKLHRAALDHPVLQAPNNFTAFFRLVAKAAFRPCTVPFRGKSIRLERGQLVLSARDFAERSGMTYQNFRTALAALQRNAMVNAEPNAGLTLITITNFDTYQSGGDEPNAEPNARPNGASNAGLTQAQRTEQEGEELKTQNLRDKPESKTSTESDGGMPPRSYAFQGPGKMRLTQADFDAWETAYRHLDVRAKLQQRADWYREKGEVPASWFIATSNWLANQNEEAAQRIKARAEELLPPNLRYPPGHPFWSMPG